MYSFSFYLKEEAVKYSSKKCKGRINTIIAAARWTTQVNNIFLRWAWRNASTAVIIKKIWRIPNTNEFNATKWSTGGNEQRNTEGKTQFFERNLLESMKGLHHLPKTVRLLKRLPDNDYLPITSLLFTVFTQFRVRSLCNLKFNRDEFTWLTAWKRSALLVICILSES